MATKNLELLQPLASLQMRWVRLTLVWVAGLLAGFSALQTWWEPAFATRWLVIATILSIYLLWTIQRGLSNNYREGEDQLLPVFGAGTHLSFLRSFFIVALAGFFLSPRPEGRLAWVPGLIYTLAAMADILDGYLARITNHVTRLGEMLDMSLDGLGMLVASLLVVWYGQAPTWYLSVGLARYLFVAGIWIRQKLGRPVYELAPSINRRPLAGVQMGFMAVTLYPVFTPPGTQIAAAAFALPFLFGFIRDWLTVSGAHFPDASNNFQPVSFKTHILTVLFSLFTSYFFLLTSRWSLITNHWKNWLPLLLRAAVVALLAASLYLKWPYVMGPAIKFSTPGMTSVYLKVQLAFWLQAAGMLLLALGAAGRVAALTALISTGLNQYTTGLSAIDALLILVATASFFLGTGAYSLWKPEDRLIYQRFGEA